MRKSDDKTRIALLEQNHITIMEQFKQYNEENGSQHKSILEALEKLEIKLDTALEKKAGVWVEKVIWGTVIFFLTGFFGYMGSVVVKYIEQ
jgi:hypothetical protein